MLMQGHKEVDSLKNQVEKLAKICHTPSPEALKQKLVSNSNERLNLPRCQPRPSTYAPKKLSNPKLKKSVKVPEAKSDEALARKLKRFSPPEPQPVEVCPGYFVKRNKDSIEVTLTEDFWTLKEPNGANKNKDVEAGTSEKKQLVELYEEKFRNMIAAYEKEKFLLQCRLRKMESDHLRLMEEVMIQHKDHLKAVEKDHEEAMEKLRLRNQEEIEDYELVTSREKEMLSFEIDKLKEEMGCQKATVNVEVERACKINELELACEFERKMKEALDEQREMLLSQKHRELDAVMKMNETNMKEILEQQRQANDKLMRKFAVSVEDGDRLKEALREIEVLKEEKERLSADLASSNEKLREYECELSDVKIKLLGFETKFEEKVAEVDELYCKRFNVMAEEATDLRRRYMKKCEDLRSLTKQQSEKQQVAASNAMELMKKVIQTRARTNVSLVADLSQGDERSTDETSPIVYVYPVLPAIPGKSRCRSAPCRRVCAFEKASLKFS